MPEFEQAFLEELDKKMDEITDRIFQLSQENLVEPHVKVFKSGKSKTVITTDSGFLLKSGNVNRQFLKKQIVYPVPYASDVEFGNNGFQVEPEELFKWVGRKLLKGKGTEAQVKRTATNILANSLAERGQSSDPFLQRAVSQAKMEFK